MKHWLLDLGNSRLKLAALDAGVPAAVRAFAHARIAQAIADDAELAPGDSAWLASVAPAAITDLLEVALRTRGLRVERVVTQVREGRLRIAYGDPRALGVDRFLALLAASQRDDGPWVVVSAGSALTADALASDGRHLGGVIAPMPAQLRGALAQRFPALDVPAGEVHALGASTADAIASGAAHALCGLVERVARETRRSCAAEPLVLIGGGDAEALQTLELPRLESAPTLVLGGLAAYARARLG
jgi:type III pantothenate kinase